MIPFFDPKSIKSPPFYSVVVPCFNEENTILALLLEVRKTMMELGRQYEVVIINDGSTDETQAVLIQAITGWPECRVLRLIKNRGQAAALYLGMKAAIAPIIITMDGDGQNVPDDIRSLLARLPEADMVVGVRKNRQDLWLRRIISRVANSVRGKLLGDRMIDSGCALKVFRREVFESFIPIRTLYSFMPAMAMAAGFRVVQEPVQHRERTGGQSKYGLFVFLWRPIVDLIGMMWFSNRRFPATPLLTLEEITGKESP